MVKRREPKASTAGISKPEPTPEQIETFAAGADGKEKFLNPNAKRDFKAVSVPFNEYEFEKLLKGAELSGRSRLNFIRHSILKMVDEMEQEAEQN